MSKNKKSKNRLCPVCAGDNMLQFMTIQDVPVYCNVLYSTAEEAVNAPRGNIVLNYCHQCGHIFNSAFESGKVSYNPEYENSLHYSPRFQEYALSLAKRLVEAYDLHGKRILEIGCGKGDFLNMLCELGENTGIGFDPSYEENRIPADSQRRFSVINDFYSEKYADYKADLILCRQVLEHIESPRNFLNMLRQSIGSDDVAVVFFEVPNVMFTLKDLGIWDLIYEHCGYFSKRSLTYLFKLCNFIPINVEHRFGGQYLCLEALAGNVSQKKNNYEDDDAMVDYVNAFSEKYYYKVNHWQNKLKEFDKCRKRVVNWGAGSKGITFLNAMEIRDQIKYIVDINPHKIGLYIPGTGQKIVSPKFLSDYLPHEIILMNSFYFQEISGLLKKFNLTSIISIA
jgi:SAM-dependent methyltransferase